METGFDLPLITLLSWIFGHLISSLSTLLGVFDLQPLKVMYSCIRDVGTVLSICPLRQLRVLSRWSQGKGNLSGAAVVIFWLSSLWDSWFSPFKVPVLIHRVMWWEQPEESCEAGGHKANGSSDAVPFVALMRPQQRGLLGTGLVLVY